MDLDFDHNVVIQCVECAETFTLDSCDEVNEASSSARCPFCGRFNYVNDISLFQNYIDQTLEEDEGGKLYDFRTGKLEDEFPEYKNGYKKKLTAEEKKQRDKEKVKMIKRLKEEYKRTLGIKN